MGGEALETIAQHEDVDTVLAAIVGSAGLRSTWAAIEAGKRGGPRKQRNPCDGRSSGPRPCRP